MPYLLATAYLKECDRGRGYVCVFVHVCMSEKRERERKKENGTLLE